MHLAEGGNHLEEGLPGEACFDEDQAAQVAEELDALKIYLLGPTGYFQFFEVFEGLSGRVQTVGGNRQLG
jgi:hypothetical protein